MAAGVAVLHPRDVLNQNHHRSNFVSPAMKSRRRFTYSNTPVSSNPAAPAVNTVSRSSRKRSPRNDTFPAKEVTSKPKPKPEARPVTAKPNSDAIPITAKLVMGQVKILRRGEVLSSSPPSPLPSKSSPTSSHVNTISNFKSRKQIRSDCYAGLAIDVCSPPPSSLPVPAFFRKKLENNSSTDATSDATNDLLKLLRLDLS